MSTLTGTKIKDTYPSLIKLDDNGAVLPTTLKTLTDGTGGSLPIQVSQIETKFTGAVDLTGVTVIGLDGAGLIAGTTANSMISAPSLTTTAAVVQAPGAIALGDNARGGGYASANHAIAIGTDAYAEGEQGVTIGKNAWTQSQNGVALGTDSHARLADCISIGRSSQAFDIESIAIGYNANGGSQQSIAIGKNSTSSQAQTIAIGNAALANNFQSVAIGDGAEATGIGAAAVGQYATASGTYSSAWGRTSYARAEGSVAFGQQAGVPEGLAYAGAIAMGRQVVAVNADTTHVRALYIVAPDGGTGGNGITMLSPNGTAGVITLTDASELAIDGTPIGGGGAAGLINDTPEDSIISSPSLTTLPAYSLAPRGIALGNNARVDSTFAQDGIAIGNNAWVRQAQGIAIGENTESYANGVSIGAGADCSSTVGQHVAIGLSASAGWGGVAIGASTQATAKYAAAIGYNADANVAEGSIALGAGVVAATAYTATVNLFQIAAYASMNYADDTAAATGGIPLGGVYHTDGALKIRIA